VPGPELVHTGAEGASGLQGWSSGLVLPGSACLVLSWLTGTQDSGEGRGDREGIAGHLRPPVAPVHSVTHLNHRGSELGSVGELRWKLESTFLIDL
jgi:hypothetical protein